jgi:hypothetical protein
MQGQLRPAAADPIAERRRNRGLLAVEPMGQRGRATTRHRSLGRGLLAAMADADVDLLVEIDADPPHPAVVLQEGDGGLLRRCSSEGPRDGQDLVGQVTGQTTDAELHQRARLAPGGGDRWCSQQVRGRAGHRQEVVSGPGHPEHSTCTWPTCRGKASHRCGSGAGLDPPLSLACQRSLMRPSEHSGLTGPEG